MTPVCVSPLLHYRLCTRARGAEVLLRFDTLAFPDRVDAGDEFVEWQDGRLREKNINHQWDSRESPIRLSSCGDNRTFLNVNHHRRR